MLALPQHSRRNCHLEIGSLKLASVLKQDGLATGKMILTFFGSPLKDRKFQLAPLPMEKEIRSGTKHSLDIDSCLRIQLQGKFLMITL